MKSGDCETCGRWDSNLKEGMCSDCVKKFINKESNDDKSDSTSTSKES